MLIEPHLCPLCQQANDCAMERARASGQAQGECWCGQHRFSAELLERLAPAVRGRACICRACAGAAPAPDDGARA